jgi:predicted flap endonuclease-1-like 5' DNA nuclease
MYEIDLTGILLCYGPLALTIIGFVWFAAMTDGDARRTYLRQLDFRPEDEQPETPPPVLTQRTVAQTPAGMRVTIVPGENSTGTVALAPAPPKAVVAAPAPEKPKTPTPISDDLTKLEGIGPKMSAALIAAGFDTYEKIANSDEAALRAAIEAAGMRLSPALPTWAQQARLAADGKWDELKALQHTIGASGKEDSGD